MVFLTQSESDKTQVRDKDKALYEAVRKAKNSASFLADRCLAKDRFRFSSIIIIGCYHPEKLKIERQQKANLR